MEQQDFTKTGFNLDENRLKPVREAPRKLAAFLKLFSSNKSWLFNTLVHSC